MGRFALPDGPARDANPPVRPSQTPGGVRGAGDLWAALAQRHPAAGSSIPGAGRAQLEAGFGVPLGHVRVHSDDEAGELATAIDARAFTRGADVFLGAAARGLQTTAAWHTLAHELAHVVQGSTGVSSGITVGAPGEAAERDADRASRAVMQGQRAGVVTRPGHHALVRRQQEAPPPLDARPVLWGFDARARRPYLSVAVPGHTFGEIATYVYGEAGAATALREANPNLPDHLPPGQALVLPTNRQLSAAARQDLDSGERTGYMLRSDGLPAAPAASSPVVYVATLNGREVHLTAADRTALARGVAAWIVRTATRFRGDAEAGLDVQRWHEEGTSSWVRTISDWAADNVAPHRGIWDSPRNISQRIIDRLSTGEITPDLVDRQMRVLLIAAESLDDAKGQWHHYIEGTIAGAGLVQHRLEVTRNVSFGIAAALAGAVVAPAVFAGTTAALGTTVSAGTATVLASGAAVTAGVGVGAGTGLTLETLGATGGELAAMTAPGEQHIDWSYIGQRARAGAWSGGISGGLGAGGALLAPGVSGVYAQRMFGTAYGNLGTVSRGVVNVATGATLGGPSGVIGAGVENAPDLARGQITGSEYGRRMLVGGAWGLALGGALAPISPSGLYSRGGTLGYGGTPVTPRWLYASPFTPYRLPPGPEGIGGVRVAPPRAAPTGPPLAPFPERATLPVADQVGFDLLVAHMRSGGMTDVQIAARLAAMGPVNVGRASSRLAQGFVRQQAEAAAEATRSARANDPPLDPLLTNRHPAPPPNSDVMLRYERVAPQQHEIDFAHDVAARTGETVEIFGDTHAGTQYPGIDGVIGANQRPLSLKQVLDPAAGPGAVRAQVQVGVERAAAAGYSHVEIHVNAPHLSAAQIRAAMNAPTAHSVPIPLEPVFTAPITTTRVVVHAAGGTTIVLQMPLGPPLTGVHVQGTSGD